MLFFELQQYTQAALSAATKSTVARPLRGRGGLRAARSKQPHRPVGSVNETQNVIGLGSSEEFKAGAGLKKKKIGRSQTRAYNAARTPVGNGVRHCLFWQCSQAVGRWLSDLWDPGVGERLWSHTRVDCSNYAPCSWLYCKTHAGAPRQALTFRSLTCPLFSLQAQNTTVPYLQHPRGRPSKGKQTKWTPSESLGPPEGACPQLYGSTRFDTLHAEYFELWSKVSVNYSHAKWRNNLNTL